MAIEQDIAATGNRLLKTFDSASRGRIYRCLERIEAGRGDVICEAGGVLNYTYFPEGAVLSLLTVLKDGSAVETINIGREGAFGLLSGLYKRESFNRALVQLPGALLRVRSDELCKEFDRSAHLRNLFVAYSRAQVIQIQQTVACNALHTTRQRICRWLLMMHDRVEGEFLKCTHEVLAQVLGANRKSVTLAAQSLQREGLITYHRGRLQVLDRRGLEKASCECYAVIKDRFDAFFTPVA
ncbi:MAG: Crp/Fnr family transcriptional regulator [Beijerinckiaceae bacterium]|nr:Crp/Fnr family transcriptional regulator [Beijerinckiaceae bacterium]MCI0735393.1 Crp/Fnr family transcriptional regulator [Beijerinckiaceae bacterium]